MFGYFHGKVIVSTLISDGSKLVDSCCLLRSSSDIWLQSILQIMAKFGIWKTNLNLFKIS